MITSGRMHTELVLEQKNITSKKLDITSSKGGQQK